MDGNSIEPWERLPTDDPGDRDETRPRKRRRKYIAKAWYCCPPPLATGQMFVDDRI